MRLFLFFCGALAALGQVTISGPTTCKQGTTCQYTASGGTGPYTYSLVSGSVGSIDSSTGIYTAPSSIAPAQTFGGVQIHPNNSIFNTAITSVPVNSSNATWWAHVNSLHISYEASFLKNVGAVSGDTTQTLAFGYTPAADGTFHLASLGANFLDRLENGSTAYNVSNDRHFIKVFKDGTPVEEIYKPYPLGFYTPGGVTNACPFASPAHQCSGQAGVKYDPSSLEIGSTGTDAGQLELLPLAIRISEIKSGVINHAARVTLDAASENQQLNIWPAQSNNGVGGSCGGTPTNCPPYGARFRLKSSYTYPGFDSICTTTACQTYFTALLTQLKTYGGIVADIGTASAMTLMVDDYIDIDVSNALFEFYSTQLAFNGTNFEWLDESSLQTNQTQSGTSGTWSEAKWDNSAGQAVSDYAVVHAVDSMSAAADFSISLQSVAVGVPHPMEMIQAGSGTVQLNGWATGASDTSVTWAIGACTGASITSGGLLTVPSSVTAGTRQECVATATSAADGTKTATVNLIFVPTGVIRINTGDVSDYTDSNGDVWFADSLSAHPPLFDNAKAQFVNSSWTGAGAFPTVFVNAILAGGYSDVNYHLNLANGTYTVDLEFGNSATATNQQQATVDAQGAAAVAAFDPFTEGGGVRYAAFEKSFTAVVTNNSLDFNVRNAGVSCAPNADYGANLCSQPNGLGANPYMLSGFKVTVVPTCGITPTSLPGGTVGVAYSQTLTNANCSSSTWSISAGSLPAGLSGCGSGSGTTCSITGTPTTPGTSNFTVAYDTATDPLSIVIAAVPATASVRSSSTVMSTSSVVH